MAEKKDVYVDVFRHVNKSQISGIVVNFIQICILEKYEIAPSVFGFSKLNIIHQICQQQYLFLWLSCEQS